MRSALFLVAVALSSCAPRSDPPKPAGSTEGALARVRRAGVLRWGGDLAGGEPFAYEDPKTPGHLAGFEVELSDAIARELGVRAVFQQNDWSQLVPGLERGGFDVILNGLEVTPRTAGRVLLTRPYYVFAERLVVRKGEQRVRTDGSLPSLEGLRVGTLASSLADDLLREKTHANVLVYEGVDTPYDDLAVGRTDAVLLDDIIADRYASTHPNLTAAGDVATGYYALGVRPGEDDLREAIDAALDRIARSGELRRILDRYNLWRERAAPLERWTPDDTTALLRSVSNRAAGATVAWAGLDARQGWLFLQGALYTILVSVAAMALAIPLGLGLTLLRTYGGRVAAAIATAYVELYRGTPVLLQLYVIYFGLADVIRFGPITAAVLGLGLNYAAYEAEVYRSALQAVPRGQLDAAYALGMSLPQALRRVILPQAFRNALPNVTNDFIALLKDSSLVSVITVVELTKRTQIAAIEGRSWLVPGVLCAALYFAMSYPLSRLARHLEGRLARG